MLEEIGNFTNDEVKRINKLINSDFEGATKEDIDLYTKWRIAFELESEKMKIQREAAEKKQQAMEEAFNKMAEDSKNALDVIVNAIKNKYESGK